MEIAISLGSNLGDRLSHLRLARALIEAIPAARDITTSPVYETEPVEVAVEHQALRFLNAILLVQHAELHEFARCLWDIERQIGRPSARGKNEPRSLDLDIIYAGDVKVTDDELTVPHPRWAVREFVVRPLCDVRPDRVLPGETRTVREVLLSLPAGGGVVPFCGTL